MFTLVGEKQREIQENVWFLYEFINKKNFTFLSSCPCTQKLTEHQWHITSSFTVYPNSAKVWREHKIKQLWQREKGSRNHVVQLPTSILQLLQVQGEDTWLASAPGPPELKSPCSQDRNLPIVLGYNCHSK